ncbi:MAG: AMP-binding protein [Bacteroidales bacterium]|nr:AMP-binding protein [Bacteroidales bacterium]
MLERFLKQTEFKDLEDFRKNFEIIVPEHFNFAYDVVDAWATEQPDKLAMIWTNDKGAEIKYTFADLKRETDKTASYFLSLGIKAGDRVMLILKRHYEFWYSILALHKINAVVIPATHLLTKADIIYRNNAAGTKAIVCCGDPDILKHVQDAKAESPTIEHLISVGPEVPEGWDDFHKGIENAAPFVRPEKNNSNDTSIIYFTSGTSGEPKMVAHAHTYALGHIATAAYWHNIGQTDIHLTVADTGWGKAVWGKLYGQWLAGSVVFVYDHEKFTPANMLEMICKYKVTSFCAPPTIYRFLIREDLSKYDLSNLRHLTTAGEALNAAVYDTMLKITGLKIHEGFGQTETTLSIATFKWMEPKAGSMGVPNPLYDIDIVAPDGHSCEDGEQGEIVIRLNKKRPVGLFKEYFLDPEKTAEVFTDNGLTYHTGDVAWRDESGYLFFVGRTDDVIKSSGYRIGPFEVESALMTHPAVVECAITGVPDPIRGKVVKATIVLGKGYEPSDELVKELQDHVKRETAPYKYPRIIEFVKELPKTISGKIRRVEIRKNDENKKA